MSRPEDIQITAAQSGFPRGSQPRILMCPPDYYGIEYEINPWMSRQKQADHDVASRQWSDLRNLLEEAGAKTLLLEPARGLPDLVFTANAALVVRDQVVPARFRHPQRRGEESHDEAWLSAAGFTLFAGYRIRSDIRGHQQIGAMFGCRVIPLELVDPYYYHLDTCFCPLAPGRAIYYPGAFDDYGLRALAEAVDELIPVSRDEARRFACNAVVVRRRVITNTGCPEMHAALRAAGFERRETPLDEFVKAGGSAKCLTLRLDGEEAAGWKYEARAKT